jgi:FkbM family methyltransferase
MKTVTLQQIRATLVRYVRDENLAAGRTPSAASAATAAPSAAAPGVPPESRRDRLKAALRRIPILSPILVTAYRLIKLPGRVALIVRQLNNVYEMQVGLTRLHDRIDALAWHISALQERLSATSDAGLRAIERSSDQVASAIRVLQIHSDSMDTRLKDLASGERTMQGTLAESERVLVALHEKSDRYQQELRGLFGAIKPIINAGDNLLISRVGDFIMAFPAEEWRLPVYQILYGQLEPGLYARMKSTIREGMSVIDIGANVGTYTLLALQSIGSSGRVISYEPTPRVFDILKNNVQINGFIESGRADLRQKAVSDGSKSRSQFFTSSNTLMNSLYGEDRASIPLGVIDVETVSLDQDLADLPRLDVIKIDAEGAEPMILRGMQRIIERSPGITIFIEFAPSHLKRAGVDMRAFVAEIRAQGFEFLEVSEPTGELRNVSDEQLYTCFSLNLRLRRAAQE